MAFGYHLGNQMQLCHYFQFILYMSHWKWNENCIVAYNIIGASAAGPLLYAYWKFTSSTHGKRSVSSARLLMSSLLGFMLVIHILYDVYFICSSSLPMDSVRCIANHDVLCFLPSETAFWRLAQNEHSSPVGRTQRETVTAKVHAERNAELLKRSPRNPASAQRSRRSLIASLLRSSPRGP